jgi:hypothetical protein
MGACQACSIFLCCRVCRSAAYHVLQFFRIPSPLHRDLGDSAVDVAQIVGRQFDFSCSECKCTNLGSNLNLQHDACP